VRIIFRLSVSQHAHGGCVQARMGDVTIANLHFDESWTKEQVQKHMYEMGFSGSQISATWTLYDVGREQFLAGRPRHG
jgi:hypothetical protein